MKAPSHVVSDKKMFENCILNTYFLTLWFTYATNLNHMNNFDRGLAMYHYCEVWSKSNERFQRKWCLSKNVDGPWARCELKINIFKIKLSFVLWYFHMDLYNISVTSCWYVLIILRYGSCCYNLYLVFGIVPNTLCITMYEKMIMTIRLESAGHTVVFGIMVFDCVRIHYSYFKKL